MANENTNSQRITSLENRIERQTLPPREAERKAPMQGDEGRRQRVEVPEQELRKELPKEEVKGNVYVTKAEVQDALNALMAQIANLVATKTDLNNINMAISNVSRNIGANFVTRQQAEEISKKAIPPILRDLDSDTAKRQGNVLMLANGANGEERKSDSAYWGSVASAGLTLGDKVFFGHKVNPNGDDPDLVRIYASEIDGIAVAQTDVTVTNNDFVYVQRTRSDNTMIVTAGGSVPADDDTYFYYKLYQFSVTDGVAKVLKYCRPFAIEGGKIPSNANKNKYMVMCLSADVGATNDPSKITWDWLRMGSLA
jgi:hypothetical protein